MKYKQLFLLVPMLLWCFASSHAQGWSGILDPSRAIDWSAAGVTGGVPNRTTVCSTLNPGATGVQIQSAIAACPAGQVVFLNPGSYTIGALHITKSNVTLRGAGADQTKIFFTGTTGGCGGWFHSPSICVDDGGTCGALNLGPCVQNTFSIPGSPANSQGVTTITFSAGSIPPVGRQILLDQANDLVSGGYPTNNDIIICSDTTCTGEGGDNHSRPGRSLRQIVTVTSVSGQNVTFTPGLRMPNWRNSQSPGAYWSANTQVSGFGIENLSIDLSGNGAGNPGIIFTNATNCWLKGIRQIVPGTTCSSCNQFMHVMLLDVTSHITIRDSYFYGNPGGHASGITQYGLTPAGTSDSLMENNIVENINSPFLGAGSDTGSVYGYNFGSDAWYSPTFQDHESGELMNLREGNDGSGIYIDDIHGTGGFNTFFRNHFFPDVAGGNQTDAFTMAAYHRFENIVGNVLGSNRGSNQPWIAYQLLTSIPTGNEAYALGSPYGSIAADARVPATLMRWGNWDNITSTNPIGTNDTTGTRFLSSEVPRGITNYANPVPGSQTLPASFYLSARPSWWTTPYGAPPWPPIGPDVANGNVNTATSPTGGHANKIPARLCWENAAPDSAYASTIPPIRVFNAAKCYTSSGSPPSPPTGLAAIVH